MQPPPLEPVAGNGLLDRRALLGRGIMFAGAMTTGVGTALTGAAAEPLKDDPWSLEMGAVVAGLLQVPSRFEKNVVRTLQQSQQRVPQLARAHAAPSAATARSRPTACTSSISHSGAAGHRSGPAPARDPRPGQAAAGLHARVAVALSDGDAHGVRRVRRQQRADVLQRAGAGQRAGAARARLQRRMDRRAALHAARRGRHRPEGEMVPRRRRRLARAAPQRAGQEGAWTTR